MPSSTWPVHVDPSHLYFITTGTIKGHHTFHRDVIKRILVDSLNTGRILQQYEIYAFVIMPNHIHLIIRCLNNYTPGEIVREYKKSTTNLIVRHFEAEKDYRTLNILASAVYQPEKQKYALWGSEYQAKNVFSSQFLEQKLEYIHQNPVQPHWRLAELPEDYIWSSAIFYICDARALIPLCDVRELLV